MSDSDIPVLLNELDRLATGTSERLTAAVEDVDKIIELLTQAREQIAQGLRAPFLHFPSTANASTDIAAQTASDPHTASLTLTRLQNPVKEGFESINDDLRKVDRVRKDFSKVLNRRFPARPLPTDDDAMAKHPELINRAITWHLLREGQFNVASVFIQEAQQAGQLQEQEPTQEAQHEASAPVPGLSQYQPIPPNDIMDMDAEQPADNNGENNATMNANPNVGGGDEEPMTEVRKMESHQLQEKFATMYQILSELKSHNLLPAINWAHRNSKELETRGSDLEFELCKRQYIYLIQQHRSSDDGANGIGLSEAMQYAQSNFLRFADRHSKEIAQLASALVFQSNLADSPYAALFSSSDPDSGFDDIASSFTREFCSLLGLSAESPLYVAATAGTISLPRLMKYIGQMAAARASWTTTSELAFETPLPRSMIYHSIFVCPVSKEQTTDENPPMMLPCGHVLARDSLKNLVRSHSRYKCPYCPVEGLLRDARQIIL